MTHTPLFVLCGTGACEVSCTCVKQPKLKKREATLTTFDSGPILSVFPALIVHSELKSVHPGFPVAFIFKHKLINK